MKSATIANALDDFDTRYGPVVTNALTVYAERMRAVAAECEIEAWCPERPAVPPRTDPDGTTYISCPPTPAGYARMAGMFTESADKAASAITAYEALTELLPI